MNIIFSENKDCITAIYLPVDYYWNNNHIAYLVQDYGKIEINIQMEELFLN